MSCGTPLLCGGSESVIKFGVGCGKPIEHIDDLYRCATCSVPMHLGCLRRHFGPGDGPLPTRVEEVAAQLLAKDGHCGQCGRPLPNAQAILSDFCEECDRL